MCGSKDYVMRLGGCTVKQKLQEEYDFAMKMNAIEQKFIIRFTHATVLGKKLFIKPE